jgi:hypothetical protein
LTKEGDCCNLKIGFWFLGGRKVMEEVKKKLKESAPKGKIPCIMIFRIARECNCSVAEAGRLCDELKIKIVNCQLGCF